MTEEITATRRPKQSDALVKQRAAEIVTPKIVEWIKRGRETRIVEKDISNVLIKILSSHKDGYEMAKELDQAGWGADSELVDIMDDASYAVSEAARELVKKWVIMYAITPTRKIGDAVTCSSIRRDGKIGIITKIYEKEAQYGVRYPDQPETSCYIVNYEDTAGVANA